MGVVSPCGTTVEAFFANLIAARSGISRVPAEIAPAPSAFVAGQVRDVDMAAAEALPLDRATVFALMAVRQAVSDAAIDFDEETAQDAGVYWGTGLGGATSLEDSYRSLFTTARGRVRPATVVLSMTNAAAAHISMTYGIRGPILNFSTACSSSAASIGEACRAIRQGAADVVIAGGSEALLTLGNLRAWESMRALARPDAVEPSRSCKPFSADRTGVVLSEGAAALILESREHAERRGARVLAEVAGYGNAGDASHIAQPDAAGQVRAMRRALADAGMTPGDIGYVNAHGTATLVGDVIETEALKQVFGAGARSCPVSSTKAMHGHLVGASGALEAIVAVMALRTGIVPPTAHLDRADPACDLDYVPNTAREIRIGAAMSNSFGFGGMNAVLIVRPCG